jgi:hypothetical protein
MRAKWLKVDFTIKKSAFTAFLPKKKLVTSLNSVAVCLA